ncbi:MAG: helix-turn-helix domain-containing protein [Acetobacter sp.]|nr:helix-turn-helix domain-containing protein [Acetobacter sp.]
MSSADEVQCLNAKEAANMLRISQSSLRSIQENELPSVKIFGKRRIWLRSDILAYIRLKAGRDISSTPANVWDSIC